MKLSVTLSEEDIAILDRYAAEAGLGSRSAAIQHTIRSLRDPALEESYAEAWSECEATGEAALWESATADGLHDPPR